jgi:hypothetical protein
MLTCSRILENTSRQGSHFVLAQLHLPSYLCPDSRSREDSTIGKSALRDGAEVGDCIGKLLQKVLLRQLFYDEFDEPIDYFFRRFRIE